jgi:DNA-directed RNA polymerase subunit D
MALGVLVVGEVEEFRGQRNKNVDVKIIEQNGNLLRFVVQDIDVAIANSLRRTMIAEVPSMAIEDVIILENPSPIRDEILAHRLGLVPLKTDLESYIQREKCDCNSELGCGKCSAVFTLEVEAKDTSQTVYSGALEPSDPYVIPVSEKIPILKLARNQKIRLEAHARLGRGNEHAKWQPVSVCTMKRLVNITIDQEKCSLCEKCVEACFKHVIVSDNNTLAIVNPENCEDCLLCVDACPEDAISTQDSEDTFMFHIESTGVLPPESIFNYAIDILKAKTREFHSQILNLKIGATSQ